MQNILGIGFLVLIMAMPVNVQGESCEAKLPDSSVYTGNCESGLFNGKGKLVWRVKKGTEGLNFNHN